MFSWSRGELWLAVVVSALLVAGGVGHLWLTHARLQGASVVVHAAETLRSDVSTPMTSGEGETTTAEAVAAGSPGGDEATAAEAATPRADAGGQQAPAVDTRININTATAAELQRLPGIGPTLAARIVAYREAWGPFKKIEDIMEVPGIGPRRFEDIKDLIKVE